MVRAVKAVRWKRRVNPGSRGGAALCKPAESTRGRSDVSSGMGGESTPPRGRTPHSAKTASRLYDSVTDRVANEIAHGTEAQLSHDVGAVRLDRLHAHPERRRRLLIALSFGDELNDLSLAGRHRGRRDVVLRAGAAAKVVIQHELSDRRRQARLGRSPARERPPEVAFALLLQ